MYSFSQCTFTVSTSECFQQTTSTHSLSVDKSSIDKQAVFSFLLLALFTSL